MTYPVNLHLEGRHCAVIGGGGVAERKVRALLEAKARVTVISPVLTSWLQDRLAAGHLVQWAVPYSGQPLTGYFLVFCTTNRREVNRLAAAAARQAGALVNLADDGEGSDFTIPSQVRRGDLLLTVSTGGKSPALSRRLREELAERYGSEYGLYLERLAALREEIKTVLADSKDREAFWRQALDEEILKLLKQGRIEEAEEKIQHAVSCCGIKP
ncbi:precorrin-2 dehydrogenase/sirohydrochlorin ferrochelatase family protein [Propionispora vibrioides]|uniref:precorrin-2 dehydrogenase n=1 Tax=Propionispora vibrioides TaxID=112903 RepID=A0A1H8VEW0_9FIRM|nr:bifunctional precorrin-2 dehydrogenase/sirohydrochlorin ferrochelatase [Propionispora vibrioides]SEP13935.1 precorrin-2 dehydrogenase / sirohydrochlorin ferrochelatase [Propionispora vibrioides]